MKEEKTGTAAELIFHNESNFYTILLFETEEEQFFAVGNMAHPRAGRSYRLLGEWKTQACGGDLDICSGDIDPHHACGRILLQRMRYG